MTEHTAILEYFEKKAPNYDAVDEQVYWKLSDTLLWDLLKTRVLDKLESDFSFLDAGGGTGRWSQRILSAVPCARGVIRDISEPMMSQARKKAAQFASNRLTFSVGSIESMPEFVDSSFDVVFNFHNVIGFVTNPEATFIELARVLRPGGYLVTVAPNFYHLPFFNLAIGEIDRAEEAVGSARGRFTTEMPEMHLFTPRRLSEAYAKAELVDTEVLGFPVLTYPGYQETQLFGSSKSTMNLLGEDSAYERVLRMERTLLGREETAARGNNLFTVAKKG